MEESPWHAARFGIQIRARGESHKRVYRKMSGSSEGRSYRVSTGSCCVNRGVTGAIAEAGNFCEVRPVYILWSSEDLPAVWPVQGSHDLGNSKILLPLRSIS